MYVCPRYQSDQVYGMVESFAANQYQVSNFRYVSDVTDISLRLYLCFISRSAC